MACYRSGLCSLEQDQEAPTGATCFAVDEMVGQSFMSVRNGWLGALSIYVAGAREGTVLQFAIAAVEQNGSPPSDWQGKALVCLEYCLPNGAKDSWVDFKFTPLRIRLGQRLVWILQKHSGGLSMHGCSWTRESCAAIYTGGELWFRHTVNNRPDVWEQWRDDGAHLAFRTYVVRLKFLPPLREVRLVRRGAKKFLGHSARSELSKRDPESYSAWVPFQFSPNFNLGKIWEVEPIQIQQHRGVLEQHGDHYVLHMMNFPSQVEARDCLKRIAAGVMWAALESNTGVKMKLGTTAESDNIQLLDGHSGVINGVEPAVFKGGCNIRSFWGGNAHIFVSAKPENFAKRVEEGASLHGAESIVFNERLRVALDMYCLAHFEGSQNAKFLAFITALEAIAPEVNRPAEVIRLIDDFKERSRSLAVSSDAEAVQSSALALAQGLEWWKRESIAQSLELLIRDLFAKDGHADAAERAQDVRRLYRKRSKLTHRGRADLDDDVQKLNEIVRRTLIAAMRHHGSARQ